MIRRRTDFSGSLAGSSGRRLIADVGGGAAGSGGFQVIGEQAKSWLGSAYMCKANKGDIYGVSTLTAFAPAPAATLSVFSTNRLAALRKKGKKTH